MKKSLFFVLALSAVVIVSACVGRTVSVDANNGLKINEFSSDRTVAEPTDLVSFFADIENVGGVTASCVRAQLLNVDSWKTTAGQTLSLQGISDFHAIGFASSGSFFGNLCIGRSFCVSVAQNPVGGLSIAGFVGNIFADLSKQAICNKNLFKNDAALQQVFKFQEELSPPDTEKNRPGQSFTADWTLVPPTLPEGVKTVFRPTVRVSYIYKTTASVKIPVMTKNEYESRINLGKPVQLPIQVDNTNAPIKIAVSRGTSPVIVNTDPDAIRLNPAEKATYIIELQNVGDGIPTPAEFTGAQGQSGKEGGFILGAITLTGSGVQFDDCLGAGVSAALNRGQLGTGTIVASTVPFTAGNEQLLLGGNAELLRMRSDKRAPFGCTLAVDRQTWASRPFGEILMTFDLWYIYNVDKETAITVKGVEGNVP